jgi:heme exporter protein D
MSGEDGFFAIGGYAAYVWTSYGVAAVVLIGLAAAAIIKGRARRGELDTLQTQLGRRKR